MKTTYLSVLLFSVTGAFYGVSPALAVSPIPLGSAQNFGVLAASAVTNANVTTLWGNVGVNPGSSVGVAGVTLLSGTVHPGDAAAQQAQADAHTAYDALVNQPVNIVLSGQDLGGRTLTPGVYFFSSSAQLTGTLTLDAQNDPNAVFIFQIGSTLTTASNSAVKMVNGGLNDNVFWQVGTSATLGTGTQLLGNILANESITLTTNTKIVGGRAIALTGAVTMDTFSNGNGQYDILWRNYSTSDNFAWHMNGVSILGFAGVTGVSDLNWRIVGTPDLNGDGKADILWRNYSTGDNYAWYMDGTNFISGVGVTGVADLNWRIVGTPDLNGDGKADILWRNYSTGGNYAWYMNGINITSGVNVLGVPDLNWRVVGTPDLNRDGKADILWRNYSTGDNFAWYMNGINIVGFAGVTGVADLNWRIVATPDLNGDGRADILWRNYSTGDNFAWHMNGISIIGFAGVTGQADLNWFIENNGDF